MLSLSFLLPPSIATAFGSSAKLGLLLFILVIFMTFCFRLLVLFL